ncbi:hypothetical protein SERLADRAFT_438415 [Serpula lacrymans var. lacrymans S7.9]|uniref:Uncharacterized protein n=1 Tax=Serpula lacrymans var. lacrymans (strain S7.9) TaxID=578457 RepID=F8NY51_SERL9|nr:uncharacterized protein SERLADRAFT_438415 [Serpula lacrymans var. lacrymans S7.9]EGO24813.1 hypothetical protein SERLADRAFT_438415 [Serpula lacrymans var. lacrymans S7.9]
MKESHILQHEQSQKHQDSLKSYLDQQSFDGNPISTPNIFNLDSFNIFLQPDALRSQISDAASGHVESTGLSITNHDMVEREQRVLVQSPEDTPMVMLDGCGTGDTPVPLVDLWPYEHDSHILESNETTVDLFEETIQASQDQDELPTIRGVTNKELEDFDIGGQYINKDESDGMHPFQEAQDIKLTHHLDDYLQIPIIRHIQHRMYLTDLLFSSPRLQFSESEKSAVLKWATEMGARKVPSLAALKKCRKEISEVIGNPTKKVILSSGTVFYINNVASAIMKDFSNPVTRLNMQDYPEEGGDGMSQIFHGRKMLLDVPPDRVSQNVRLSGKLFYIHELLQCASGAYFIPERFYYAYPPLDGGNSPTKELYALGYDVTETTSGFLVRDTRVTIPISHFQSSYEDIRKRNLIQFSDCSSIWTSRMPNQFCTEAPGKMVYSIPLIVFMDDVSGNISKAWNKHYVIYMSNASMPREMLQKEFNVYFVTSSPHTSPMELMKVMKDSIEDAVLTGIPV